MKNNKGFTLVELVVVIALMAVIAGVSSYTVNLVTKQELKDFSNNLDAMLCQCKIETMSGMTDPALVISIEDQEYVATLYKNYSTSREVVKRQYLGENYLTCTYYYKVGNRVLEWEIREPFTIDFQYDRNTGELENKSIEKIEVGYRQKRGTYAIEFVPETGYHRILR